MKSDNKSLANEISAAILGKLHGLNAKSAKKLVKAVDECSKDIVKKFAKLHKDEEQEQEKDAIKSTKKLVEKDFRKIVSENQHYRIYNRQNQI